MEKVALYLLDKYTIHLLLLVGAFAIVFYFDFRTTIRSPRINLSDNNVELIKWIGLVFMTADHVNKCLLSGTYTELYNIGRSVMPLFAFVLAYNLARPGVTEYPNMIRIMKRLFLFACISTIPFIALGAQRAGWWPLNILFTLLFSTISIYLFSSQKVYMKAAGVAFFLVAGALSEYWWPSMLLCITCFFWIKTNRSIYLYLALLSLFSLSVINQNHWAFSAIPILFIAALIPLKIPRLKMFFYIYYPAHLSIIYLIKLVTI